MKLHIKWLFVFILFAGILSGCNNTDEGMDPNGTNDDLENVGFGPGQNNQGDQNAQYGGQNRDRNDFPFFDGNNDGNVNFPYESDRGFNFNHRNNETEEDNSGQTTQDRQRQGQQGQQGQNGQNQQGTQNGEAQTNQSTDVRQIVQQVVDLTNAEREKQGLQPLEIDRQVNEAAQAKSVDMADNGYFSHTSPTYGSPFDMLDQFDINYTAAAENIAAGQNSAEEVVKQWMNSEGHRKNIMNGSFTHIGIGYESSGNMSPYWTQLFITK